MQQEDSFVPLFKAWLTLGTISGGGGGGRAGLSSTSSNPPLCITHRPEGPPFTGYAPSQPSSLHSTNPKSPSPHSAQVQYGQLVHDGFLFTDDRN